LAKERLKEEKGKDEAHCALDHLRDLGEEKRSVEKRVRGFGEHLGAFLRRGGRTSVGARLLEHGGRTCWSEAFMEGGGLELVRAQACLEGAHHGFERVQRRK
jgi:hypothetical protein